MTASHVAGQAPRFFVSVHSDRPASDPVGMGFVVGHEHILTCAHVVNTALGRDPLRQDKPERDQIVTLRLPTSGGAIREARVDAWLPPPRSGVDGGDIAGLVITGERLPDGLQPARLSRETPSEGEAMLFGYPVGAHRPAAEWVSTSLHLHSHFRLADRLLQLRSDSGAAWPGYSGAPLLDQASGTVVAMLRTTSDDARGPDSYAIGATALFEAWEEVLGVSLRSPYKGLGAFDEEDVDVFVGREEEVARLERAVRHSPVVMVVGAAGVGKSSLVQAGLLPALRKSGLWTVARCRPGSMPFQELAAALFRAEGVTPGVEAIRQRVAEIRSDGLADLAATIRIARGRRLLVVVDQLEELFTVGHDRAVVAEFLETILSPMGTRRGTTVVATVRADFFPRLLAYPNAAARLDGRLVPISSPDVAALRRIVREPAVRQGVVFASGLVDRIVRDMSEEAGALPLLGFTLSELWSRQRQRVLTHEAYEEIGGLEGSLRAHAEATITTLVEDGTSEATLRGALLSLLGRTDERMPVTRRHCPVDELPVDQQTVIEALVGARLVTMYTDRAGRRVAELAHEFLLRAWPRLVRLAEDDSAFVRWRGEVEQWQARGYGLLPEPMIAEARRWCDERPEQTDAIRDLVERSEAEQRRRVRELERLRKVAQVVTVDGDGTARVLETTSGVEPASHGPATPSEAVETEPVDVSVPAQLRWVHRRSGLTWDQIARLFGVSRRAVHTWVAGGRINATNGEHLGAIVRVIQQLPYVAPEQTRELLMASSGGTPSWFDRLRNQKVSGVAVEGALSVPELLGIRDWTED